MFQSNDVAVFETIILESNDVALFEPNMFESNDVALYDAITFHTDVVALFAVHMSWLNEISSLLVPTPVFVCSKSKDSACPS